MAHSIAIIGAGLAGLSAGCYAQMNGYHSEIFELHTIPGGLCTSWRRRGYLFDGSIRYLVGTAPGINAHTLWQELGVLEGRPIHYYDEFSRYEAADGRAFSLFPDVDRLEAHMLALSPADERPIRELAGALRAFGPFDLPVDLTPDDPQENLQLGLMMLPFAGPLLQWQGVTLREFAGRFRDPLLRDGLASFFQFTPPDFPFLMMALTVVQLGRKVAGYPIGGSLDLAEALARRYQALGGRVHYSARVARILTAEGRAAGVRLEDGREFPADIVISAADGRATLFDLLDDDLVDETTRGYYRSLPASESILQISLGVARDFSAEPPSLSFPLQRPVWLGDRECNRLVVKHYSFDPTMADPGKACLSIWVEADYGYWATLRQEPARYEAEKEQVAQAVIGALDARYPGLQAQVEAVDVATPVTYERYTANWHGAIHGWAMGARKLALMMGPGMRKTLPGLRNFYMIGQWVEPGGNTQLSAASGRDVLEMICRADGRPFRTAPTAPAP